MKQNIINLINYEMKGIVQDNMIEMNIKKKL